MFKEYASKYLLFVPFINDRAKPTTTSVSVVDNAFAIEYRFCVCQTSLRK